MNDQRMLVATFLGQIRKQLRLEDAVVIDRLESTGVKNPNQELTTFETSGDSDDPEFATRLAAALGLPWQSMQEIEQAADQAWQAWLDEPVPMKLIVRAIPGCYTNQRLPENVTTPQEAEAFARDLARRIQKRMCLVVSRRKSIWIGYHGEIEKVTETQFGELNEPSMSIGGHRFMANVDFTRFAGPERT